MTQRDRDNWAIWANTIVGGFNVLFWQQSPAPEATLLIGVIGLCVAGATLALRIIRDD